MMINRPNRALLAPPRWDRVIHVTLALVLILTAAEVSAQSRRGDRFGLRGGIWPQSSAKGNLGELEMKREDIWKTVVARFDEPSTIAPFIELYGLFHLKGALSIEAAVGWSMRQDVQVKGFIENDADSVILLGEGRVDFIPLFVGLRGEVPVGGGNSRHNVYGRGGLSLIFANESPSNTHPGVDRLYSPGSEGAPGFVLGGGGEYYFARRYAATIDAQFRYAWFTYTYDAKFSQASFWLSIGILVSTR